MRGKPSRALIISISTFISFIMVFAENSSGESDKKCETGKSEERVLKVLKLTMQEAEIPCIIKGYITWYVAFERSSKLPVLVVYCSKGSIMRAEKGIVRLLKRSTSDGEESWRVETSIIADLVSIVLYRTMARGDGKKRNKSVKRLIRLIPDQIVAPCGAVFLRTFNRSKNGLSVFMIARIFHRKAVEMGLDKWKGDEAE
jgi:hypothetical protein